MSAKSVIAAVTGFLAHHVGDLSAIHSALSELVSVAPIDSQDKDRINSVLETVQTSANNINDFLNNNHVVSDAGEVTIKESDIEHAVAAVLPNLLAKAVADYLAAHPATAPSTEGNANG